MASQHVESLMIARNSMVEVRRRLALKIGNPNMQPPEHASNFGAQHQATPMARMGAKRTCGIGPLSPMWRAGSSQYDRCGE